MRGSALKVIEQIVGSRELEKRERVFHIAAKCGNEVLTFEEASSARVSASTTLVFFSLSRSTIGDNTCNASISLRHKIRVGPSYH